MPVCISLDILTEKMREKFTAILGKSNQNYLWDTMQYTECQCVQIIFVFYEISFNPFVLQETDLYRFL